MSDPRPATILIVDDDETVTQVFAQMLELEGYAVRTAITAAGGLEEVAAAQPDAIILDFRMPLVDGLGFMRRLREYSGHRATPVAIVTGDYFLEDDIFFELQSLGAELRFKPLWLEDLVRLTHNLLNARVTH